MAKSTKEVMDIIDDNISILSEVNDRNAVYVYIY